MTEAQQIVFDHLVEAHLLSADAAPAFERHTRQPEPNQVPLELVARLINMWSAERQGQQTVAMTVNQDAAGEPLDVLIYARGRASVHVLALLTALQQLSDEALFRRVRPAQA